MVFFFKFEKVKQERYRSIYSAVFILTGKPNIVQISLPQWSVFLLLDVATLKFEIIIIILPTDRPEIILSTAPYNKKLSCLLNLP